MGPSPDHTIIAVSQCSSRCRGRNTITATYRNTDAVEYEWSLTLDPGPLLNPMAHQYSWPTRTLTSAIHVSFCLITRPMCNFLRLSWSDEFWKWCTSRIPIELRLDLDFIWLLKSYIQSPLGLGSVGVEFHITNFILGLGTCCWQSCGQRNIMALFYQATVIMLSSVTDVSWPLMKGSMIFTLMVTVHSASI